MTRARRFQAKRKEIAIEEGVAAEGQIIRDGPCADKPSLSWAGEVEE